MDTITEPTPRLWLGLSQRTQANRSWLERIKSIPQDMLLTFSSVDWFNSVNQFRTEETDFLCQDGRFEATLDSHRATVAQLIAQGETLVTAIKSASLVKDAGFTVDDIRATIESLRETFKGVHGPHNHPVTNEKILAILEAA
jgi:hypothetical protein